MNRTIFLIIFIGFSLTSASQKCQCPTFKDKGNYTANEIGINIFNLPINRSPYLKDRLNKMNFVNGVLYKRHFNKNAIRLGFNYFYSKFDIDNGHYKYEGKGKHGELKLGYERILTSRKLQVYFATDIIFGNGNSKGVSQSRGVIFSNPIPYNIHSKKLSFGPSIGLKYPIINKFSLNLETNINWAFYKNNNLLDPDNSFNNRWFNTLRFNPIQMISLNYNF